MAELDDLRKRFPNLMWEAFEEAASELARKGDKTQEEWIFELARRRDEGDRSEVAALKTAKEYGWDTELIKRALLPYIKIGKTSGRVIEELANELWIEFGVHGVLKSKSETHTRSKRVLPISLISYLAARLLESCLIAKVPPAVPLIFLIRDLLTVEGYGHNKVRTIHQERCAILYLANNPKASTIKVAREVGVNKTTVSRWMKDANFLERVEHLKNDDVDRLWENEKLKLGLNLSED